MTDQKVFVASAESKAQAKQLRLFAILAWVVAMQGRFLPFSNSCFEILQKQCHSLMIDDWLKIEILIQNLFMTLVLDLI